MKTTLTDIFFMSIRWTIFLVLIYEIGFIKGIVIYFLIQSTFQFLLRTIFGLQHLNPVDNLFLQDNEKNPSNITSAIIMEKFDAEKLKEQMVSKGVTFLRTRSKIVKVFGEYYFKELTPEEFEVAQKKILLIQDEPINDEKQLAEVLAKESVIRDSLDLPQLKVIWIRHFGEDSSAFMFKCHHSLADGLGLVILLSNIQDNFELSSLPLMKQLSWLQKLLIFLMLPVGILQVSLRTLVAPREKNGIQQGAPLKGKKNGAISKDIPLDKIKLLSKKTGYTINDIMQATMGFSLKKYMLSVGDTKTNKVTLGVPFSIRETPNSRADLELRNDFSILKIPLDLSEDLDDLLKKTQKKMSQIKNSTEPFAMYYFTQMALQLPILFSSFVNKYICNSITLSFSNVPGPREPFIINGYKSKKMIFYVPGLENIGTGISIITHENVLKIACQSDESQIANPQNVIDFFEDTLDKLFSGDIEITPSPRAGNSPDNSPKKKNQ